MVNLSLLGREEPELRHAQHSSSDKKLGGQDKMIGISCVRGVASRRKILRSAAGVVTTSSSSCQRIRRRARPHTPSRRCPSCSTPVIGRLFSSNSTPGDNKKGNDVSTRAATFLEPIEQRVLFRYLNLQTFSDDEFHSIFQSIKQSSATTSATKTETDRYLSLEDLQIFLEQRILEIEEEQGEAYDDDITTSDDKLALNRQRQAFATTEAKRILQYFHDNIQVNYPHQYTAENVKASSQNIAIDVDTFSSVLHSAASSLDWKRTLPLTLSMLLVGTSVGIATPAMPFVRSQLGLTAGEYGTVVAAFAISKMLGNIPSAVMVERHGRKPYLVYSMAIVAVGVGGIGMASSMEQLFLCRLLTGFGVASLSTATTMTVTDVSTPLNRASTLAPIMSAFAAGTALGPAVGGFLVDNVGIAPTFYIVGTSYIGLAAVNHALLEETKYAKMHFPCQREDAGAKKGPSIRESFQDALGQWIPLLSQSPIRHVCIMNGFYWIALAGSQITLLPLLLTDPGGLAMTATQLGQVYMGMSIVQVVGNPVLAKLVDHVGKAPGIIGGCTLITGSMAILPYCSTTPELAGVLAVWAAGSSMLSTSPVAFISDNVKDSKRAQAIALLRTSGDVGFLIGASSMGALADAAGSLDLAIQASSGILFAATGWFTTRQFLSAKITGK